MASAAQPCGQTRETAHRIAGDEALQQQATCTALMREAMHRWRES